MSYELPNLPYSYDALEPYIDAQTMETHHTKHHQGYVDKLNAALVGHEELMSQSPETLLSDLQAVPDDIRLAVQNNGGGHANHSFFWTGLTDQTGQTASGQLADAITQQFGTFDSFKEQFSQAALGRFGSGWAWLVKQGSQLVIGSTANQNSPIMGVDVAGLSGTPLLCLDVWEHAYYLKYQNKRADYISAVWNIINWSVVQQRYSEAS